MKNFFDKLRLFFEPLISTTPPVVNPHYTTDYNSYMQVGKIEFDPGNIPGEVFFRGNTYQCPRCGTYTFKFIIDNTMNDLIVCLNCGFRKQIKDIEGKIIQIKVGQNVS